MDAKLAERRILLVDDDEASRLLVKRTIREFDPSVRVDEAETGEDGAKRVRAHHYGLVISDYHMSYMNGIDLLEITKSDAPQARRVLITGRADLDLVKESLDRAHVHGFIKKSVFPEDMRAELFRVLRDWAKE